MCLAVGGRIARIALRPILSFVVAFGRRLLSDHVPPRKGLVFRIGGSFRRCACYLFSGRGGGKSTGRHLPLGGRFFAAEAYAESAALHLEAGVDGHQCTRSITVRAAAITFPGRCHSSRRSFATWSGEIGRSLARARVEETGYFDRPSRYHHMTALAERGRCWRGEGRASSCVGFASDPEMNAA